MAGGAVAEDRGAGFGAARAPAGSRARPRACRHSQATASTGNGRPPARSACGRDARQRPRLGANVQVPADARRHSLNLDPPPDRPDLRNVPAQQFCQAREDRSPAKLHGAPCPCPAPAPPAHKDRAHHVPAQPAPPLEPGGDPFRQCANVVAADHSPTAIRPRGNHQPNGLQRRIRPVAQQMNFVVGRLFKTLRQDQVAFAAEHRGQVQKLGMSLRGADR